MSVAKRLREALDYIDSALDILREIAGESRAVSYTHLTLPTILLV